MRRNITPHWQRVFTAVVMWAAASSLLAADLPPVLTTAEQIHRLTSLESAAGMPVSTRGIITYIRGIGPEHTLQDATGGVMLDWLPLPGDPALDVGTEIRIEGHTSVNPPTPRVKVDRLEVLGKPGLPVARTATIAELLTGDLEGSLVEFTGLVRSVRIEEAVTPPRLTLEFGPVHSRLTVWVSRWNEQTRETFRSGATVRVRGVLMRWKTANWLPYSTFAVAHDPTWLTIVKTPVPTETMPLITIPEVLDTRPNEDTAAPMKVRGIVTLNRSPEGLVVQGDGAALWVRPVSPTSCQPGDLVEAVGFPGPNGIRKELEDAVVTRIGREPLPVPAVLAPEAFANVQPQWMDSHLVRIRGKVRQGSVSLAGTTVWLDFGQDTLTVLLPPPAENAPPLPAPGSVIEVTGVLEAHLNPRIRQIGRGVSDYELHLQGPENLAIIQPASWWTRQRLFGALVIILLLAAGSALWALSLRKRVAEKSAALAREITARHDQEILADERQRLARDLHDTIEQTLTGAALQLDAVEATHPRPEPANTGDPLRLARRLLDRSRDELRRAVWDLTPGLLEQRGLHAALLAMAGELSRDAEVVIEIHCDDEAGNLPDRLAAHLCSVVQEATSNAIRHGRARHVTVDLRLEEPGVTLSIADNGCGFDPATAPGITGGHFGLNGMKERLRRLGGNCEVHSRPGEGSILRAGCPIEVAAPPGAPSLTPIT